MAQQKKVLVADDEAHVLQVVSARLRNAGYEVLMACDGREALERAQQDRPDLVIADYAMPHLSGLELCQRLKHDPKTSSIPAILLGASGYGGTRRKSQQRSIYDRRLDKPFTARNLLASVSEILDPVLPS